MITSTQRELRVFSESGYKSAHTYLVVRYTYEICLLIHVSAAFPMQV